MSIGSRLQQKRFASAAEEAVVGLLVVAESLWRQIDAVCQQHGITHDQYNVLRILRGVHPDGHPRYEITNRLICRAPDVTRLLDRLERQGLVVRGWHPENRRLSIARVTDAGLDLLDELDPEFRRIHADATSRLSAAELDEMVRMLGLVLS